MLPREIEAKYEVRGTLGSGAMGTVHDAMDRLIERRVAVKVVKRPPPGDPEGEEAHARFRREAVSAGRLNHPNIVAVYDYGENAETAWIVMELVEGGSLKQRLDRQERFTIPEIVRLMDQMLQALAYSHGRGVVHRDIKPGNVMLTADGTVKIADFGIARLENSSMTQVGTVIGTPSYMAPEQLRGETVDARADIWAAGVVLYQLLTGEKPFDGGFSAVMHKALHTEPPPPSQLSVTAPRAFDAVVARAMAKRPEDRFATATAFAEAIRAAAVAPAAAEPGFAGAGALPGLDSDATMVSGATMARPAAAAPLPSPAPAAPPPGAPPPAAPARKAPIGLILGAGGGLAAAGLAAWLLLGQGGPATPPVATPDRETQIQAEAERRAREEAERLRRQLAEAEPPRQAPPPTAPDPTAQRAEEERQRTAEAQRQADAQRQTEAQRQADAQREAEAQRAAEAQRQAEAQRRAEAQRQADAQRTAEAERQRQEEAQRAAELERQRQLDQQRSTAASEATVERQRAQLRAAAAAAAIAEPCSLITWSVTDDRITLAGMLRRGGEAAIRQALDSRGIAPEAVQLQLQSFEGPYCAALDAIRPIVVQAPEAPPRARVIGTTPLAKGELLRMRVDMPDYPSQLYVSYFMKSGEVVHLVPSRAEPARSQVALGEPGPGFPGWEVDEPFGTDLVVVFASERPIFAQRRPVVENQADYLATLTTRVRALQAQGARITARALLVETVPQR